MKLNDVVIMPNFETAAVYGQPVLPIMEELNEPEPLSLQLMKRVEIPPLSMVQCQVYVPNQAISKLIGTVLPEISGANICGGDDDQEEYEM